MPKEKTTASQPVQPASSHKETKTAKKGKKTVQGVKGKKKAVKQSQQQPAVKKQAVEKSDDQPQEMTEVQRQASPELPHDVDESRVSQFCARLDESRWGWGGSEVMVFISSSVRAA